jgi:hypothetical protein
MRKIKSNDTTQQLGSSLKIAFILFLNIIFIRCQENVEGCLDIKATNFVIDATKQCKDNCCVYPNLIVRADYVVGNKKFNQDTLTVGGEKIKLLQIQFYLSDFQLFTNKNELYKPLDSFSLIREKDTLRLINNVALLAKSNGFDFNLGAFKGTGIFGRVQLKVGLNDTFKMAVPSKMPLNHPLSLKADSMYISSKKQYIFNKIVFAKGQQFQDTVRLFITEPGNVNIVKNLSFTEGFDGVIPLKINYLRFFDGVTNLSDENSLMRQIVSNYGVVFTIQ